MTDADFDTWTADLFRKFPAIAGWTRGTGGSGSVLLADWRDVLVRCELPDLLEVNVRMLSGDDDGPGKFATDWQVLPAHVRRLAQAVRLRREINEPVDPDAPCLKGPRYSCIDCRDSGRRFVAHWEMVKAWFNGNVSASKYRTAVVLCACPAAEPIRTLQSKNDNSHRDKRATYRDGLHFGLPWDWLPRWELGELPPDMRNEFVAWCEASYEAWRKSRRFAEIDQWNNQR